jgi:ABC-type nitrate/sulfonate/bicarbonate transport system substrate-binding protein
VALAEGPAKGIEMNRRDFLQASVSIGVAALFSPAGALQARAEALGKVAYQLSWIKNFQFAGEYVAEEKKYYTDQGLEVDLLAGGPTLSVEPVIVSDKALIGQVNSDTAAAANAKGAGLKIIGVNYQKSPFSMISMTRTALKTPQDMVGKKVGIQNVNLVLWNAFLKINKIDPKGIHVVPVQFDFSPLVSGEVDGFFGYSNDDVVHLREKGNDVTYFLFGDFGYKLYTAAYAVRADSLADKAKRAQIVAFLRGSIKGWQDVVKDPTLGARLTVDVYGKGNGLNEEAEYKSCQLTNELMLSPVTEAHGLFWMSDEGIKETIDTMAVAGLKATPEMFTNEILAEIYQGKSSL